MAGDVADQSIELIRDLSERDLHFLAPCVVLALSNGCFFFELCLVGFIGSLPSFYLSLSSPHLAYLCFHAVVCLSGTTGHRSVKSQVGTLCMRNNRQCFF